LDKYIIEEKEGEGEGEGEEEEGLGFKPMGGRVIYSLMFFLLGLFLSSGDDLLCMIGMTLLQKNCVSQLRVHQTREATISHFRFINTLLIFFSFRFINTLLIFLISC
jgi:hypothetical protein